MSEVPTQIPMLLEVSAPPTQSIKVPMKATVPSFPIVMSWNESNVPVVPGAAVPCSVSAMLCPPGTGAYSASKFALRAIGLTLAQELTRLRRDLHDRSPGLRRQ